MRKVTKNIVGVLSLGVLATSWSLGQAAETGLSLTPGAAAGTADTSVNTDTATPSATPTDTVMPTPAPPVENGGTAPSSKATATATPTATPTPTPTATKTTAPAVSADKVTKTSAAINYVAHRSPGTMQISVTKSGSKITDITIISGGTEGGQWAQVPDILAQAAIKSQGANFGNLSGATHTTEAFYQALDSALAKF